MTPIEIFIKILCGWILLLFSFAFMAMNAGVIKGVDGNKMSSLPTALVCLPPIIVAAYCMML